MKSAATTPDRSKETAVALPPRRWGRLVALAGVMAMGLSPASASADDPPCTDCSTTGRSYILQPPTMPCEAAWHMGVDAQGNPQWYEPDNQSEVYSGCWGILRQWLNPNGEIFCAHRSETGSSQTPMVVSPAPGGNVKLCPSDFKMDVVGTPPPNFLPPSPTIGGSSACLLPPGASEASTGWQGLSRPMLGGVVDLATGLPMVQFTQLELPMDGAMFRLTRTRSQSIARNYDCLFPDDWWDWTGEGWMSSESPFLLIDSAVPDIVGDNPRTTFLILDAFHSIPFQMIETTAEARYEAPARFRSRLRHNGVWNPATRHWTTRPTYYVATLYDGQIEYTFGAVYDDVPTLSVLNPYSSITQIPSYIAIQDPTFPGLFIASLHERAVLPSQNLGYGLRPDGIQPSFPGGGVPYYGLCTKIADRYGNSVNIKLCGFKQVDADITQTALCRECLQSCGSKGQIEHITLRTRDGQGQERVRWTLLYKYRTSIGEPAQVQGLGPDCTPPLGPQLRPLYANLSGERMVDTIWVYEGDMRPQFPASPCDAIDAWAESGRRSGGMSETDRNRFDAIDAGEPTLPAGPLQNWRHKVRYHYDVMIPPDDDNHYSSNKEFWRSVLPNHPQLLKTSVVTRTATATVANAPELTKNWVFWYEPPYAVLRAENMLLEAMFTPEDVSACMADVHGAHEDNAYFNSNHLAFARIAPDAMMLRPRDVGGVAVPAIQSAGWVQGHASIVLSGNRFVEVQPSGSNHHGPAWGKLKSHLPQGGTYVRPEATHVIQGGNTAHKDVKIASIRTADATRHYRIYRLAVHPIADANDDLPLPGNLGIGRWNWSRGAWHVPYAWAQYPRYDAQYPTDTGTPDYSKPRWISVIDEFDSQSSANAPGTLYGDSANGPDAVTYELKKGQLSRRVVEVSPSGVVLSDKIWRFDGGSVAVSGGGLGEEFVYENAVTLINAQASALGWPNIGAPPEPVAVPFVSESTDNDSFRHLRYEQVLVEHKSVGWSATTSQNTEGMTRFYEYLPRRRWTGSGLANTSGTWDVSWAVSLDLTAEGVSRGQHYERVGTEPNTPLTVNAQSVAQYSRQILYPASSEVDDGSLAVPGMVWESAEVQFLAPASVNHLLTQSSIASYFDQPPPAHCAISFSLVSYAEDANVPRSERRVTGRMRVGVGKQVNPGSDLHYPVEREWYDADGNMTWAASGLVVNPAVPAATQGGATEQQSLSFTRYLRDGVNFRPMHTIMDVQPRNDNLAVVVHPDAGSISMDGIFGQNNAAFPAGWQRIGTGDGKSYVTSYNYSGDSRLTDIYFPNRRQWASRVILVQRPGTTSFAEKFAREFIFNDIERNSNGTLYSRMLGEIRDYDTKEPVGNPVRVQKGYYAESSGTPCGDTPVDLMDLAFDESNQPSFIAEAEVKYFMDATGRVATADVLERRVGSADMVQLGRKEVNDLVDCVREEDQIRRAHV